MINPTSDMAHQPTSPLPRKVGTALRARRKKVAHGILAVLFLACCLSATGQSLQFRASDLTTAFSGAWQSVNGAAEMKNSRSEPDGWQSAEVADGAIWFGEGVSPLEFPDDDETAVAYVAIVGTTTESIPLSTLVSSPSPWRIAPETVSPFEPLDTQKTRNFAESFRGKTNVVTIGGIMTSSVTPSQKLVLFECGFWQSIQRREVFLGGNAAFPERGWRGGIAEIILLAEPPAEREINAIRQYVSLKYKMRLPTTADAGAANILRDMGINTGSVFSTLIMVR